MASSLEEEAGKTAKGRRGGENFHENKIGEPGTKFPGDRWEFPGEISQSEMVIDPRDLLHQ
jgi:hypothetical protein